MIFSQAFFKKTLVYTKILNIGRLRKMYLNLSISLNYIPNNM